MEGGGRALAFKEATMATQEVECLLLVIFSFSFNSLFVELLC